MVSKMIALPLAILFVLAVLSSLGLGDSTWNEFHTSYDIGEQLYDSGGHAVCTLGNFSAVEGGESGRVVYKLEPYGFLGSQYHEVARWDNGSIVTFDLFYDTQATRQVMWDDITVGNKQGFQIASALGFIAAVVGLMALAVVVGVKVFGFGTSNGMVVVMGTAYLGIWGVFSALGFDLIMAMDLLGPVIYLTLTLIYTLGIIGSFQGGSDD